MYRYRALMATMNAYLRADTAPVQVSALGVMAEALEANGRGRAMIPALRLAQSIAPRQDTADALDAAIAKYGFRIVEHTVDNDCARPRICAEFSEDLVRPESITRLMCRCRKPILRSSRTSVGCASKASCMASATA